MQSYYKEKEIIEKCRAAITDVSSFYACDFINYSSITSDTGELCTEVISEFVMQHIGDFENIRSITRQNTYNLPVHNEVRNPDSNRTEEIIAKELYEKYNASALNFIGKIIDCQTPLKDKQTDKAGKIDLLSDDGDQLIILELKAPESKESMLRCVLEGYTYLKTVDKKKLLKDFGKPENYGLSASPFVFKGGSQYRELQRDCSKLKKLMERLGIIPYYLYSSGSSYFVTDK